MSDHLPTNRPSTDAASTVKRTFVPMQALYDRIDHVRGTRVDLPKQLREIATEIPSARTAHSLSKLAEALDNKTSAAEIASKFPEHCWLLTLQSTAATTDALTAMLEQSTYQDQLRSKKIRSIAYPVVLMSLAFAMSLAALTLLIPPFDEMYQEFELMLPAPTMALVGASRFVSQSPLLVIGLVIVFLAGLSTLLWLWIGEDPMKRRFLGTSISIPVLRQSLAKVALQIAELCDDGLTLGQALKIAAESASNTIVRSLLGDLAVAVAQDPGQLRRSRAAVFFPPNFLFALRPTGPTTGFHGNGSDTSPNTTMLRELAISYRELSIRRKEWFSFLLAQFCVIGVGLLIGFIVIALFMPLVSLITSLSS